MKKSLIVLALVAVSAVVGGLTAYLVMNCSHIGGGLGAHDKSASAPAGTQFTNYRRADYPDLTYAAENAVQGVVNIEVTQVIDVRHPADALLEFFGYSQPGTAQMERKSGGSGVIVSSDGYIVTNDHVVQNASKLRVKLYDGRTFEAAMIGSDPTTDIALIKVDAEELPSLPWGNSDRLRLGEWVLAIGSPFDLHSTITAGIVSAKARNLGTTESSYGIESFIQTDAAVNPGNSGGALVNTLGELVGINTLIKSPTGSYSGYSFAVPVSIVSRVVYDLQEYGAVRRAFLGVSYMQVNDDFLEAYGENYGISEPGGFYLYEVHPDGAAAEAGIHQGDIVVGVDDIPLGPSSNLSEVLSRYRPGDKVRIYVKRDGKVKHFDLTLRNKAGGEE